MEKARPVFISVTKYRFPITAIISILHRISGFVLFLFLPLLLYILHASLISADYFQATQHLLASPWMKLLLWILLAAVIYHLIAGIRHLIMDMGWLESKIAGKTTSYIVLLLVFIGVILAGVWLW